MEFVGIDVSKASLDVAAVTGEQTTTRRVANGAEAIAGLVAAWGAAPPTLIALEATGVYHQPLLAALVAATLPVALVNPAQVKAFRQTYLGRHKTDRADAVLLARFAEVHGAQLRRATPSAPQQARLRALVGYRDGLVKQRTQIRNRGAASDWTGEPTVAAWLAADLAAVEARLGEVEAALAALLADLPEARVLLAMPGIGLRIAAAVLAYLPVAVWGDAKAAAAYAGVHPRLEQSGTRARSRLSKQGHRRLRRYLYIGALVAIRRDAGLGAVYDRLVARGKAPQSAVCAVMHKLLRRMMGELRAFATAQAAPAPLTA